LLCALFWLWLAVQQQEATLAIRPVGQGVSMPDGFSVWHHLDANGIRFKSITPQKDGLLIKFDSTAQARRRKRFSVALCHMVILSPCWRTITRPPPGYPACATRRIGSGNGRQTAFSTQSGGFPHLLLCLNLRESTHSRLPTGTGLSSGYTLRQWKVLSMKHRIALLLALSSLSASAIAASPCQEKEQDIQREISYAEKHHNQSRIDGLNTALRQVRENCSDSKLKADHQQKIAKQREEIAERQRDLQEARKKGDADKINKRQHKLNEAQQELKTLESRDY
jgi:hypothetical protein